MSGTRKQRRHKATKITIDLAKLDGAVSAAKALGVSEEDHQVLVAAKQFIARMMPTESDESASNVLADDPKPTTPKPRKGTGRRPRSDFPNANTVEVPHVDLKPGQLCSCGCGKLYPLKRPLYYRYFEGRPAIEVTIFEREQLRCSGCGEVFTAELPEGVGPGSYDASARSTFAFAKYGQGMPMYRQAMQYAAMGTPIAVAVIYAEMAAAVPHLQPAVDHMVQLASEGVVAYFDDTTMPILNFEREPDDDRTGLHTTGIVSDHKDFQIALFLTGREHAGENRATLLKKRPPDLPGLIQMSDALSANFAYISPSEVIALCLAHGRRNFVKIVDSFPVECRHVIEAIAAVYHNDAVCREERFTAEQRLAYHQKMSQPVMDDLKIWLDAQITKKKAEPNSDLGKAVQYMRNHWEGLTLFLRVAEAPLDSNAVERILKKVVLHRKNSLFYKTAAGAKVGDTYMTLIVTCQLNKINPHEYLTVLQRNHAAVKACPGDWMPWTYKSTIERNRGSTAAV